jgi:hypothetical protein
MTNIFTVQIFQLQNVSGDGLQRNVLVVMEEGILYNGWET